MATAKKKVPPKAVKTPKRTMQQDVTEAIHKINVHEIECALRYKSIEERLAAGSEKFDKLEKLVWGIYPFILLLFVVEKFGG